jgi:hypothetical protein
MTSTQPSGQQSDGFVGDYPESEELLCTLADEGVLVLTLQLHVPKSVNR